MLSQQTGRYLFKTFRTLLANPDAPMSEENRTAGYILKVRHLSLVLYRSLTVASYSTSRTRRPRLPRNSLEISRILNSSSTLSDIELPTSPPPPCESEISSDERGTRSSSISSDARSFHSLFESKRILTSPLCSVAHSQFVLVQNFANAMQHDAELKAQPAVHHVMKTCFELFGMSRSIAFVFSR